MTDKELDEWDADAKYRIEEEASPFINSPRIIFKLISELRKRDRVIAEMEKALGRIKLNVESVHVNCHQKDTAIQELATGAIAFKVKEMEE